MESQRRMRERRRAWALERLGGVCVVCGCSDRLEFDHIDPSSKLFSVSQGYMKAFTLLEAEVAKCQLLCRPCHSKKTWGQIALDVPKGQLALSLPPAARPRGRPPKMGPNTTSPMAKSEQGARKQRRAWRRVPRSTRAETSPLARIRLEQGWTLSKLALRVGVTYKTVMLWESGTIPRKAMQRKLARVLFGRAGYTDRLGF